LVANPFSSEELVALPGRVPMPRQPKSNLPHPYKGFEGTRLWKAVNKGIGDLVENQDLNEKTQREYIVGYLCKILVRRRGKLFSI
jgi:hypothetical protein